MNDYRLDIIEQPAIPASWLPKAKHQVRLEVDEHYDDSYLVDLIRMAYQYILERSDIALMETRYLLSIPCFPIGTRDGICLLRPPLVSVESIVYVDCEGNTQTMDPAEYRVSEPFSIVSVKECWPQTLAEIPDAVRIQYTAGRGEDHCPQFMQALRLLVGHWYRHREDTLEVRLEKIPHGVDTLIDQMRPGDEFSEVFVDMQKSYYSNRYRY